MTTMLVTRPNPDAMATAVRLRALDIDSVLLPLFERRTLDTSLPEPDGFAAMAVTSANALRALADRQALPRYRQLKVFTVGDMTAVEAESLGFQQVTSAGGAFADLVELLAQQKLAGPIFYPAGRDISGDLARSLAPFGLMVVTTRLYEMNAISEIPQPVLAEIERGEVDAALFYSRRAAEAFVRLVGSRLSRDSRAGLAVLCLSERVAEPLMDAHFVRVSLADYPDEEAMMTLALSFAREQNGA